MKKSLIGLVLLLGIFLSNYGQKISELPPGGAVESANLFVVVQSGTTKKLTGTQLSDLISDTANILRAEFPPLWRSDISDTADVLRILIASAVTTDTAWIRQTDKVFLRVIGDDVGIGTETPAYKLDVVGTIKGTAGILDNGNDNIILGELAGSSIAAGGERNIFVGEQAGESLTTADDGIFIGHQAGEDFVSGGSPVLIGYQAGANMTGSPNIAIGWSAGAGIISGNFNTFLGTGAGLIMGGASSYNTVVGQEAALVTGTSDYHSMFGAYAGQNITEAGSSIFGAYAGQDATSAVGLSLFGRAAGTNITTSDYHSVFGYQALDALQTEDGSAVFGYQAGSAATGAEGLTAVGYKAGALATIADRLTLVGYHAGTSITTGSNSTFIGWAAGDATTTGDFHTAVGMSALGGTNDGAANAAFGYQSGDAMSSGSFNTFHGYESGGAVTSGDYNTFVGSFAGNSVSTQDGNVFLGNDAGKNATVANELFIDNSSTATPLIHGDFSTNDITVNGALTVTGNMSGLTGVSLDTDPTVSLATADCRNKARFNNDADVIDYTLPGAAAGLVVIFYDIGGGVITIDPVDGTDTIYLNGTSVGAGDAIDSPGVVGDYIALMAIDATRWITIGRSGTWVDGGTD